MFKYLNAGFPNSLRILSLILVVLLIDCKREKYPFNPDPGHDTLIITTDRTIYYWQRCEDNQDIVVQGTLQNNSAKIYCSQVGDHGGWSEVMLFAGNSAGQLEKFNVADNSWDACGLLSPLIEGPRFMEIELSRKYSIHAHLVVSNDKCKEETGKYRLRIDFYNNPEEALAGRAPFSDYSNVFEIRAQ